MKSEQEIQKEIKKYQSVIEECYTPDDYEIRDRFRAKIYTLEWVLEIE